MLVAALAGLGRLDVSTARSMASDLGFELESKSRWAGTLREAADRTQPGTVVVLSALGMQVANWDNVPPECLYEVLSAYRRVGLEGSARMIAAEAITRA